MAKMIGMMRLGRDAELRYTEAGDPVARLSLAYNYGKADHTGRRPVTWVDASLWGKRAEALSPYLLKGTAHCFTLDEVHIETYESAKGPGHKLVGRVMDVELGARQEAAPATRTQQPQRQAPARPASDFSDMDSDIPF